MLESGQGVALKPGTRVTVFLVDGAWRQEITMDAEQAVPVPDSHPDEIAAQTLVNPVTVLMLRRAAQQHFSVGFDGVVLNNAAASAVGRCSPQARTTTRSSPSASCATRRGPSSCGTGFRKFPWCRRIHPTGRPACRDAASGRSISVALDPHRGSNIRRPAVALYRSLM